MLERVENLRLTTKMVVPFALLLLVALGIVALAERSLSALTAQTHEIIEVTAARQAFALGAAAAINSVAADEKNAMLMTDKVGLDVFASAYVTDIDHLKASIAGLKNLSEQPADIAAIEQIESAIEAYYATGEQLYELMVDRAYDKAHAHSVGAAQIARERAIDLINRQVVVNSQRMAEAETRADALYQRTVRLLLTLSFGGLACAIALVTWIMRRFVVRPLAEITGSMGRLSDGDLDIMIHDVERKDEIGVLARALRVFREHGIALRHREAELRTARDEAIFANRSKSEFLAIMSHELRTPLNAIIGFSAVMRDETFGALGNARYRSYANDIHSSGAHLLAIINDILDLAKIDAGRMELHEENVDLVALCAAALRMMGPRADEEHILLRYAGSAEPLMVRIDERLLKQAFLNLVSNAVKFSHPGGEIDIDVRAAEDGAVEIRVIDRGIGMRDDDIPLALKPFVQIENAMRRRYQGTGLGLSLSKAIAELHGGALVIESQIGAGTTATIRLPAKRRQAAGADVTERGSSVTLLGLAS
jgi:signal transduction histidine kinase